MCVLKPPVLRCPCFETRVGAEAAHDQPPPRGRVPYCRLRCLPLGHSPRPGPLQMQQPQVTLGEEGAAEILAASATRFTMLVARLSYLEAVAHANAGWPIYSAPPSFLEG